MPTTKTPSTELRGINRARGRREDNRYSHQDAWAARYPITQAAVERARLFAGKAVHRAHRDPLPVKQDQV